MVTCVRVSGWADMGKKLTANGPNDDHWVSCLAEVSAHEFPEKCQTFRVEDQLVSDIFTHCYYCDCKDVKSESYALLSEIGLGLRRKMVRTKNMRGVMFGFMKEKGVTLLSKGRDQLDVTDKKLSAQERVKRTAMSFDVCSIEHVFAEAKRHPGGFWLTANTGILDVEKAKEKAVTTTCDGEHALVRFRRCLIVESADCQKDTLRISKSCGHGLRNSNVRAKMAPGTVMMFLTGEGLPPLPVPGQQSTPTKREPPRSVTEAGSAEKRRRPEAEQVAAPPPQRAAAEPHKPVSSRPQVAASAPQRSAPEPQRPMAAATLPVSSRPPQSAQVMPQRPPVIAKAPEIAPGKAPTSEELYCQQMEVLEKRLSKLLPGLPRERLSTEYVQTKLEESMSKPHGRFDQFKLQIGRVWRSFLESTKASYEVPDVD